MFVNVIKCRSLTSVLNVCNWGWNKPKHLSGRGFIFALNIESNSPWLEETKQIKHLSAQINWSWTFLYSQICCGKQAFRGAVQCTGVFPFCSQRRSRSQAEAGRGAGWNSSRWHTRSCRGLRLIRSRCSLGPHTHAHTLRSFPLLTADNRLQPQTICAPCTTIIGDNYTLLRWIMAVWYGVHYGLS